jgi:dihydrofolate reductase
MSLDGFIAGPNDSIEHIFDWYSSGDTEYTVPSGTMTVKVSSASAAYLKDVFPRIGALVTGRRTFDLTNGWGGRHPAEVPVFVVTHNVPEEWLREHPDAPFTFVTDGVESAVAQAKAAAGGQNVGVGAASIAQQCINAGLLVRSISTLRPAFSATAYGFSSISGSRRSIWRSRESSMRRPLPTLPIVYRGRTPNRDQ